MSALLFLYHLAADLPIRGSQDRIDLSVDIIESRLEALLRTGKLKRLISTS